jgi:hypothetical protein
MSRGLHVGHMGAVVVHCMGEFAWREPKPAPLRTIVRFYREWRRVIGVATRSSAPSFPRSSVDQKNWRGFGARLRLVDSTRAAVACQVMAHVELCHSTDPEPQVGNDNFIDDDEPRPRCAAGRMVLDGTFASRDRYGRAAWCASRAERRSTAWRDLRSASHRQFGQQRIGVARCRCPAARRHAAESVIAASTMSEPPPLAYAKLNRGEREALGPARGRSPPWQVIRRNAKQDRLAHGRVCSARLELGHVPPASSR